MVTTESRTSIQTQICIVGCGQCGSNIAAYFNKIPSFLKHRDWDSYPFKSAAIDTNPTAVVTLQQSPYYWQDINDIHIIPLASKETVLNRLFGTYSGKGWGIEKSGAGGFPYMGTLTAEEHLLNENSNVYKDLAQSFRDRKFTSGSFLFANSLSGGTGTGFSPIMPEFFSKIGVDPRIILNLSIVPQLNFLVNRKQTYPANILYGLYQLAHSRNVDAVILADNDVMGREFGCKGNPEYNNLLHEILSGILLNTVGKYGCPSFYKNIDPADIRRTLKPAKGFGPNELCTLCYSEKKPPKRSSLRYTMFKGRLSCIWGILGGVKKNPSRKAQESKAKYVVNWLRSLADAVFEKEDLKTTVGNVKADSVYGAIGVIAGPPSFFNDILEGEEKYHESFVKYLTERITGNIMISFLEFPDMKKVNFSMIISGISSQKLEHLYDEMVPESQRKNGETLMQRIRKLNPKTVEDLMLAEIRNQIISE